MIIILLQPAFVGQRPFIPRSFQHGNMNRPAPLLKQSSNIQLSRKKNNQQIDSKELPSLNPPMFFKKSGSLKKTWNFQSYFLDEPVTHIISSTSPTQIINLICMNLTSGKKTLKFIRQLMFKSTKTPVERIFVHMLFSTHPNLPDLMAGRSELYLSSLGKVYKHI